MSYSTKTSPVMDWMQLGYQVIQSVDQNDISPYQEENMAEHASVPTKTTMMLVVFVWRQACTIDLIDLQYTPRNMHTDFALLCFVVVIHWLIFPYPSGLLHWHCGNLTIAPVPAKQPWWIWINTSCEFIMNNCITTTKQSTTKPCAYLLGYNVYLVYFSVLCYWHVMVFVSRAMVLYILANYTLSREGLLS